MYKAILALISLSLYLAGGAGLTRRLARHSSSGKTLPLVLAGGGLLAHGTVLYGTVFAAASGLDFGFFDAASVIGWLMAALLIVASLTRPLENLGIFILPIAGITVILSALLGSTGARAVPTSLGVHVLTSVLAYSVLAMAAFQAMLLAYQDHQLRRKQPGGVVRLLPPLLTMEELLFQMLWLGFGLLSLSLLTGFVFLDDMFAQHLVHKTALSIMAWVLFGVLLLGRWRLGWRGRTAIHFTVGGFVALMLAYFGSKAVLELILAR